MKVVIIENDLTDLKTIREVVMHLTFDRDDVEILIFSKYCEKLQMVIDDRSEPKVYITDIELENSVSGIQIAKKIREEDWESQIIFMTNHDKMFETVYRNVYDVFCFIEKFDNMEERLTENLKVILSKKYNNKLFEYKSKNAQLTLYLKEIIYIERDTSERKLIIYTKHNRFKVSLTIQDMLKSLDDNRFRQSHKSCIVNIERISKYDWGKGVFITDVGEEVPLLSKNFKKGIEKNAVTT